MTVLLTDGLRLFVILAGIVMLGLFITHARKVRDARQFAALALVCFGVSAVGTEIDQMGHPLSYRLVLNVAAVILGHIFLYRTYRNEAATHSKMRG